MKKSKINKKEQKIKNIKKLISFLVAFILWLHYFFITYGTSFSEGSFSIWIFQSFLGRHFGWGLLGLWFILILLACILLGILFYFIIKNIKLKEYKTSLLVSGTIGLILGMLRIIHLSFSENVSLYFTDTFSILVIISNILFIYLFFSLLVGFLIKSVLIKSFKTIILIVLVLSLLAVFSDARMMDSDRVVHQYISKESEEVWKLVPYEMKEHLKNSIYTNMDPWDRTHEDYDLGDDIITGSAEEDITPLKRSVKHFWEPDNPKNGNYSDGLWSFTSSYDKARGYWKEDVIKNYIKGDKDKAYYYLGRIAHLIEDASVPEHMHLDAHLDTDCTDSPFGTGDSALECNTKDNHIFSQFNGATYAGKEYNYSNPIPSFTRADWEAVNPKIKEVKHKVQYCPKTILGVY